MPNLPLGLIIVLILVLCGEFINGLTDAPNAIATVISTRVISPVKAVLMAAILDIAGVLLAGTAVAMTVGRSIVDPSVMDLNTIAAAIVGIVIFSSFAWYFGLPISKSHELFAGLAGAAIAKVGISALLWGGWKKILLGLLFSTFLGFIGGLIIMLIVYRLFAHVQVGTVRKLFGKLQIASSAFMAFSHGTNDGQKFIGIFTLALFLAGHPAAAGFNDKGFQIPLWVILPCALTMGFGTLIGGWRIIKTMGFKITKLEPVQGFAAETGAAVTIEAASLMGIPLSTTHTISTSIMGVGATKRFSAVRWGVTSNIILAWILTFPCCGLIAYLVTKLMMLIGG